MKATKENIPNPKEIEKEISEFLSKKFGGTIKVLSPAEEPVVEESDGGDTIAPESAPIDFHLKPEELIAHLDQFVIQQDAAKAVLATKICTHFNRIQQNHQQPNRRGRFIGSIKNNVLMVGPTGVGKTYMIKLIAEKLGVPFVKGDATKFSETGYVGGDVEDLIRDLVREADDDLSRAQYGIVYIDEIDKIASSRNLVGADVSRTGVQRALLKPMEETDVDLKVPHDPVSMLQEIERFRRSGGREDRRLNTKNILFIMSGAFTGLEEIVERRLNKTPVGFGATFTQRSDHHLLLNQVASEDLIAYGFESEFVGRLPVRAVFEPLGVDDLHQILRNPNNPIVLGKKLDFDAYGIDIHFSDSALRRLAENAATENTGARGLVGAVERALIDFERRLPSTNVQAIAVTPELMADPTGRLEQLATTGSLHDPADLDHTIAEETNAVAAYLEANEAMLTSRHALAMTPTRIQMAARLYVRFPMEIEAIIDGLKSVDDSIKQIELDFYQRHDITIVIEPDAVDSLLGNWDGGEFDVAALTRHLTEHFEMGLKLVRDKTGQHRFFISQEALESPESFISQLLTNGTSGEPENPAIEGTAGTPPASPPTIAGD